MSKDHHILIAIDGPSASGKGMLGRLLAGALDLAYLDTGKLYRAVGREVLRRGQNPEDREVAEAVACELKSFLRPEDLDDPELGRDDVGQAASQVAYFPGVREALYALQREFAENPPSLSDGSPARGAVLDGRDIGTVICPEAEFKFYVTAPVELRAERRMKELQSKGIEVTYDAVLEDMKLRDERDSGRSAAPLRPAEDAVTIENVNLTPQQVLDTALKVVRHTCVEDRAEG